MKKNILLITALFLTVTATITSIIYYFKIKHRNRRNTNIFEDIETDNTSKYDDEEQNTENEIILNDTFDYSDEEIEKMEKEIEDLQDRIYSNDICKLDEF